jgi:hypothetical protein
VNAIGSRVSTGCRIFALSALFKLRHVPSRALMNQDQGTVGMRVAVGGRVGNYFFVHGWQGLCPPKKAVFRYELVSTSASSAPEFAFSSRVPRNGSDDAPDARRARHAGGFLHLFWINDGYKADVSAEAPMRLSLSNGPGRDALAVVDITVLGEKDGGAFLRVLEASRTSEVWLNRVVLEIVPLLDEASRKRFYAALPAVTAWEKAEKPLLASLERHDAGVSLAARSAFYHGASACGRVSGKLGRRLVRCVAALSSAWDSASDRLTNAAEAALHLEDENRALLGQLHLVQEELELLLLENRRIRGERDGAVRERDLLRKESHGRAARISELEIRLAASGAQADPAADSSPLSPELCEAAFLVASSANPTEAVATTLGVQGITPWNRFLFLREVAKLFFAARNRMVALGFIEEASRSLDGLPESCRAVLVRDLLAMGGAEEAFEMALRGIGGEAAYSPEERQLLQTARDALQQRIYDDKGHGHEVLLSFLSANAGAIREAKGGGPPVLIEIGTTRESASGQGSTRRLMEFCRKEGFHFITVDMDSANAEMAALMFRENGVPFEAVHSKGEDFLAAMEGSIDCVFLDAYDFDHGRHSELRQSRYEKFLGARISDADCHRMHLDCAKAVAARMMPWTVVCMDDTWLEDGRWVAKGALAMPFLLNEGLGFLDVRNRSALLGGPQWFRPCPPSPAQP